MLIAPRDHEGLEIRLFGSPSVRASGAPLAPLHSRRGLWLLALLALRGGRPLSRSKLAGLLWPDSDETTALQNLRQTLANLRRALGPMADSVVAQADHTLRLETGGAFVDALAFDAGLAEGSLSALEHSISLYSGPLLEGCDEPWAVEEREPRAQAYLEALERLAQARIAAGDHPGAAAWLRTAVAADPYRESVRRALMQSLAAVGEVTAAMEVYRDLRERLHADLNADPDPATVAVYQTIRNTRGASNGATSAQNGGPSGLCARALPFPGTELVGRAEDIRAVCALLADSRLITLTGTGGVGKTRMAIAVARHVEQQDARVGGVAYAGLATLSDAETVPGAVLYALGGTEGDGRLPAREVLRNSLAKRNLLLVMDNCEHLLDACTSLANYLLENCPGLRILATSRQALGIPGEVLWRVPSLEVPPAPANLHAHGPSGSDIGTETYPAVRLFMERACAADPTFRWTPAMAPYVAAVCRLLDGIPLAIELAAVRVRSLPVEDIGARLRDGLRLVSGGGSALPSRHQTLENAFRWSWNLLDTAEQVLLRRLSVFASGFTLTAAERICSGSDLQQNDLLDLLTALVDKSFIIFARPPDNGHEAVEGIHPSRYHMLQTVRQFAAARLREAVEEEKLRGKHLDYYLDWAEEVQPKLWQDEQAFWFEQLEREHDNLRAALAWAVSEPGSVHREMRLALALSRFWDTNGHLREGSRHLEQALSRCTSEVPATLRAQVLGAAGWAVHKLGDAARARRHYELAVTLYKQTGDGELQYGMYPVLATVVFEEGDYQEARALMEKCLAMYRKRGTTRPWFLLNNFGDIEMRAGNVEAARAYFEESRHVLDFSLHPQEAGITHCNLGEVELHSGRLECAQEHLATAIRAWQECGAIVDVPSAIELMACVALRSDAPERAATLLGIAEALRDQIGVTCRIPALVADTTAAAEQSLGAESYQRARATGGRMDLAAAMTYALDAF